MRFQSEKKLKEFILENPTILGEKLTYQGENISLFINREDGRIKNKRKNLFY